jgi:hypothetical protein
MQLAFARFACSTILGFMIVSISAIPLVAEPDSTADVPATEMSQDNAQVKPKTPPPRETNLALGWFGSIEHRQIGNHTQQPSDYSNGVMVALHSSTRWWTGFTTNYAYNVDTQSYASRLWSWPDEHLPPAARVKTSTNEISMSYMVRGPKLRYGLRPFASIGSGALIFTPVEDKVPYYLTGMFGYQSGPNGQLYACACREYSHMENVSTQARVPALFDVGVDIPLPGKTFGKHVSARAEYRGRIYQAPSLGSKLLDTGNVTIAQMPTVSLVYKF